MDLGDYTLAFEWLASRSQVTAHQSETQLGRLAAIFPQEDERMLAGQDMLSTRKRFDVSICAYMQC